MLKKITTKYLILFLSVFSLSLISPINNNANANMLNKFKKGFYFEKYENAEEAQKALLELHPIGSDVEDLVSTLDAAGGRCGIYETKVKTYTEIFEGKEVVGTSQFEAKKEAIVTPHDYYRCDYMEYKLPLGFGYYSWVVYINVENTNHKAITKIVVGSGLSII